MFKTALFLFLFFLSSCIFKKFRRSEFAYTENGQQKTIPLVVPKGYKSVETKKDSAGNDQKLFHYRGNAILYFVRAVDTTVQYQPIDYGITIPAEIFGARYYKGVDVNDRYWRENRSPGFISGYRFAKKDNDWKFDSSLNYFTIHAGKLIQPGK